MSEPTKTEPVKHKNVLDDLKPYLVDFYRHIRENQNRKGDIERRIHDIDTMMMKEPLTGAIKALEQMESLLESARDSQSTDNNLYVDSMLASVHMMMGSLLVNPEDSQPDVKNNRIFNADKGEAYLKKVLNIYIKHGAVRKTILHTVRALSELADHKINQKKFDEAVDWYKQMEVVCMEFKQTGSTPIRFGDLFVIKCDDQKRDAVVDYDRILLKATDMLFMIFKLEELPAKLREDSLRHGVSFLNEMLSRLQLLEENFGHTIQVMLSLAEYFIKQENFVCARYQMGSALHVLKLWKEAYYKAKRKRNSGEFAKFLYSFYIKWKWMIGEKWTVYGISLMIASDKRMKMKAEAKGKKSGASAGASKGTSVKCDLEMIRYRKIDDVIEHYVYKVPSQLITTYQDALTIFAFLVKKWMDEMLLICEQMEKDNPSRNFGQDRVKIFQDFSVANKTLLFYAPDDDHKQVILEDGIKYFEDNWKKLDKKKNPLECNEICKALGPMILHLRDIRYGTDLEKLSEEQKTAMDKLTKRATIYLKMVQ